MYGKHIGRRRVHANSAGCATLDDVCAWYTAKLLWKERAESLEMLCQAHGGWKDNASLQRQVICADPPPRHVKSSHSNASLQRQEPCADEPILMTCQSPTSKCISAQ